LPTNLTIPAVIGLGLILSACGSRIMAPDSFSPELQHTIGTSVRKCQSSGTWDHSCFRSSITGFAATTHRESCYVEILRAKPPGQVYLGEEDRYALDSCVARLTPAETDKPADKPAGAPTESGPGAGKATFAVLEKTAASGQCLPVKAADRVLDKIDGGMSLPVVETNLSRTSGWRKPDVQRFLVLTAKYAETCKHDEVNASLIYDHVAAGQIDEETMELAVKRKECGFLKVLAGHDFWPYARTFAGEIETGNFERAEITRVLWIETLEKYEKSCGERLSTRERIAAEAKIRRLHRIIGLDDPTLIEMRLKMVEAIKSGASDKILAYSRAISEREQALDGANAAEYRAKLATIEKSLAERTKADKTTAGATGEAKAASGSKGVAETAANVAQTVKSVGETVETTRQILSVFGI